MKRTHIVILGAGYAGIRTAKRLLRTMGSKARLTIIDRKDHHTLMTNLHEAASGRVHPDTIAIPLASIFTDQAIELVQDEVHYIDFENNKVRGDKASYSFDYLVVATGSRMNYDKVEGATRYALSLESLESAWMINNRLARSKTGSVVICGGGLTAVEMAGELRAMHPGKSVTIIQSMDTLVPDLDPKIVFGIEDHLEKIGVRVMTGTRVIEIREKEVLAEDGDITITIDSDLTLWSGGVLSGLPGESVPRAMTDEQLRLKNHPRIFVAGDSGMVGPATVENSHQQADTIVRNIQSDLEGKPLEGFKGSSRGMMISIGPKYGFTNTKIPLKGWPAAVLKFIVDLLYVLSIAGPVQGARYFMGSMVNVPHKQTLVGGLLSTRGQRLWLFPLRIYLGVLWFTEGYKKIIGSNNYNYARKFSDYFRIGEDSWLKEGNLMIPFEWLSSSDAVSGATIHGTDAPLLENLPLWYEGIMRTIMPNPSIAMFFQTLMVYAEFVIGVGLLLGLFTWLLSGMSFLLAVNLVLAGAGGWEMSWIIPASIALMGGAGQFLGLDQFVMPFIRRHSLLE